MTSRIQRRIAEMTGHNFTIDSAFRALHLQSSHCEAAYAMNKVIGLLPMSFWALVCAFISKYLGK